MNPMSFLVNSEYDVKVIYEKEGEVELGYSGFVKDVDAKSHAEIFVNKKAIFSLAKGIAPRLGYGSEKISKLAGYLIDAVMLHEVAHLVYTFGLKREEPQNEIKTANALTHFLTNIMEDERIESKMGLEHPKVASYFKLLSKVLFGSSSNAYSQITTIGVMPGALSDKKKAFVDAKKEAKRIANEFVDSVKNFVRLKIVQDTPSFEVLNPYLPMIVATKYGELNDVKSVAKFLHLLIKNFIEEQLPAESRYAVKNNKIEFRTELGCGSDGEKDGDAAAKSMPELSAQDIGEIEECVADIEDGEMQEFMAGIKRSDDGEAFKNINSVVNEVVAANMPLIESTRKAFSQLFLKYNSTPAYDGDINMQQVQQAYVNSLTRDESKSFLVNRKQFVDVGVAILRDVSGSTRGVKKEYADSTIILLASLESMKSIKTLLIDFNHESRVTKTIEQSIYKSTIDRIATGGTVIEGAYDLFLENANANRYIKKWIVFVICDGEVELESLWRKQEDKVLELSEGRLVKLAINGATLRGYTSCKISDLPQIVYERVRGQL